MLHPLDDRHRLTSEHRRLCRGLHRRQVEQRVLVDELALTERTRRCHETEDHARQRGVDAGLEDREPQRGSDHDVQRDVVDAHHRMSAITPTRTTATTQRAESMLSE